jgi:hypothetical protein
LSKWAVDFCAQGKMTNSDGYAINHDSSQVLDQIPNCHCSKVSMLMINEIINVIMVDTINGTKIFPIRCLIKLCCSEDRIEVAKNFPLVCS